MVIAALLIAGCSALPHQHTGAVGNPYVKILNLQSYQNGADFGHTLTQEDGTASGQKVAPDGLIYGFYSYVQADGQKIRVNYRAGKGVGYEVLSVEGLNINDLGNLKPTFSKTPEPVVAEPQVRKEAPVQVAPEPAPPVVQTRTVQHVQPVQPVQAPILPQINPLVPSEPTPAPHRFDYPANLNLQRTGTGFRSSFKAL